jgi:hypothetical protein
MNPMLNLLQAHLILLKLQKLIIDWYADKIIAGEVKPIAAS